MLNNQVQFILHNKYHDYNLKQKCIVHELEKFIEDENVCKYNLPSMGKQQTESNPHMPVLNI